MANNRFSKELEDLLKEERKAISLDDLMQDTAIAEDTTPPADQLEDTIPEDATIVEDTTPPADQLEDTIPEDATIVEDTTPPADQLEDTIPEDTTPPADQPKDEFTTDPLAYVREKYNISSKTPDTSYQDLKDLQRRSSIQRSIGNLDKALGKLGSWYDVEAKRRGYDVPGYTGGAFERSAEESEKQFKERQAFQEKQRQKEEQEFTKTKSAFDFERTLREFDQSTKNQQELSNPTSSYSKFVREFMKNRLNIDVPENISADKLFKAFPILSSGIKTSTKNTQIVPGKNEQGQPSWLLVDKNTGEYTAIAEIDRAKRVMTDAEGNIILADPEKLAGTSALPEGEKSTEGLKTIVESTRKLDKNVSTEEKQNQPLTKTMRKELDSAAEPYFKDVVQKANQAYNDILGVKQSIVLARDQSKISDAILKVQVAKRVLGEVGNLAQHDKAGLTESQAILDRIEAGIKKMLTGGMTETNINEVEKAIKMYENRAKNALNREYKGFKDSTSELLGIYPERLDKIYAPRLRIYQEQQPKSQQVQTDKIIVRDKNGKKFQLPRRQLERALSEGYEVVE